MQQTALFTLKATLCLLLFALFCKPVPGQADGAPAGEQLFMDHCASCHQIGRELTGPDLSYIQDKRELDWLVSFIKNPQAMISSGDALAIEIYNNYEQVEMPANNLSEQEILAVLGYIQSESGKV